jgi:O-antigen/teichoic acid export membrane protein
MQRSKYLKRAGIVSLNAANSLIIPVLNIVFSFLVIKLSGTVLWGSFVYYLVIVNLAAHILNWGNKEYLLREFSRNVSSLSEIWRKCLLTRFALFPLIIIVLYFFCPSLEVYIIVSLWVLLLFIYQSFDVLILYTRKFYLSILIEAAAYTFLFALLLLFSQNTRIESLIFIFVLMMLLKTVLIYIFMRKQAAVKAGIVIDPRFFSSAFPFFVLGLSGMLISRIDLYLVAYYLPKEKLGMYQVLTSFLLSFQAIASFVLTPFVKNLYRLANEVIRRVNRRMFLLGVILTPPFVIVLYPVLRIVYGFDFPARLYVLSGLYVLPIYYYITVIYKMYKINRQPLVVWINSAGFVVNFMLNIFLIPVMGIEGALLSGTSAQWFLALVYLIYDELVMGKKAVISKQLTTEKASSR